MTRKLAALAVSVALLTSGCGVGATGVIFGEPAPSGLAFGIALYFVEGGGTLVAVRRATNFNPTPSQVLAILVEGPTAGERESSYGTEIPPTAAPVSATGTTVTVSVDERALSRMAINQLVCTAQAALRRPDAISVVGNGNSSGPRSCPVPGSPPAAIPGAPTTG